MNSKLIFLIIALMFTSLQLFSQVHRRRAKHQDTCLVNVISTQTFVKKMPIDSTNNFYVNCNCELPEYKLSIFDRWGNVALLSNNIGDKLNLSDITNGIYVWIIEVKYPNGKKGSKKGTLKIE